MMRRNFVLIKYLRVFSHFNFMQKSFLEKVLAENPGLPCFCFGHSTGAAIILKVWTAGSDFFLAIA